MTHGEIMDRIKCNPTIGDYISLAVADGWTKEHIIRNLYDHILTCTGEMLWNEVEHLYVHFMETLANGAPENRQRIVKPVAYKGVVYKTVRAAARANGVSHTAIQNAIKNGAAKYV